MYVILGVHHYQYILKKTLLYFFLLFSMFSIRLLIFYNSSRVGNRPFPSSKESHFQNEAKCETFVVKMRNICIIIENHFHINGFALSLALKVRFFGTRKWPIRIFYHNVHSSFSNYPSNIPLTNLTIFVQGAYKSEVTTIINTLLNKQPCRGKPHS